MLRRRARSPMPIHTKLMICLLLLSTLPLLGLGWFVSGQIAKSSRKSVGQVQEACQRSIERVYGLGRYLAQQRANQAAKDVADYLRSNPEADLADLGRLAPLQPDADQWISVALMLDDHMVPTQALSSMRGKTRIERRDHDVAFRLEGLPETATPPDSQTCWAVVPGTNLRIAATQHTRNINTVVSELVQTIGSISDSATRNTADAAGNFNTAFVVGVVVIVLSLIVINVEVARSITRPVQKLTAAAEQIRSGQTAVDLDVGGSREITILAEAFQRATSDLQQYAESLERRNVELDAARTAAERTSQELRSTQQEMIQMEKMSSLGRLVAGVAHEINTPTGAICNMVSTTTDALDALAEHLGSLRAMSREDFEAFQHLLNVATARQMTASRLPRREKRAIREALEAANIPNARNYSDLLAKCHITDHSDATLLATILDRYGAEPAFSALLQIRANACIGRTSAEKIAEIVRALKFYSHSSPQQERTLTDVNQTLRDALAIAHNRIKQQAEIVFDLDENLPKVACLGSITEVWVNLFTNACDAIEERGTGRGHIYVRGTCEDGLITVEVTDDGVLVPAEIVGRVFDPFCTSKPPGKGTGLGLSVVMKAVKRDGGSITLRNEEGHKGFTVTYPAVAVEVPA